MTKRIAMWSGPRNLSTAMMYSFAARGDTRVVDEPFYAAFLEHTGADHPMRDVILARHASDPKEVMETLKAPVSEPIFYQKHMAHHMSPDWPADWMDEMTHVLLIRHPARVIASYAKKREAPSLADLGYVQQAAMMEQFDPVIVVDSGDIRTNPAAVLAALCQRLDILWTPKMLHWPKGGHPQDGAWAPHWYGAVHNSTGFDTAEGELPALDGAYVRLLAAAMPFYLALAARKLKG